MTSVLRLACLAAGVLIPECAGAHSGGAGDADPWTLWPFEPEILASVSTLVWFYVAGWIDRSKRATPVPWRRHACFLSGVGVLVAALQSPLDTLADHSFAIHQVQHLLLGTLGPILLMLAAPQALLIAGMPRGVRNHVLAPLLASSVLRRLFAFLAHPTIATFIAIAGLLFWHIPAFHDQAVLSVGVHYAMHVTFLFSGLFFFWRILDLRPPPLGTSYGVRIAMSLAAIAATAPLGAYLTLKSSVLYAAYDVKGRLSALSALQDEQLGGLVMWVPGGLALAVPMLIVIKLWGAREERLDGLRQRGIPLPGGVANSAASNRRLAWRLGLIATASAVTVIVIGFLQRFLP